MTKSLYAKHCGHVAYNQYVVNQQIYHIAPGNPPVGSGNPGKGLSEGLTGSVLVGLAGDLLHTLGGEPSHAPTHAAFPETPFSNAQH